MYWLFNISIGCLFLAGGSIMARAYLQQGINGIALGSTVLIISTGFDIITSSFLTFGIDRLYWIGIVGQLHLISTIAYLVWKLNVPNRETTQYSTQHKATDGPDRTGNSQQLRGTEDSSR